MHPFLCNYFKKFMLDDFSLSTGKISVGDNLKFYVTPPPFLVSSSLPNLLIYLICNALELS